jgi:alpha-N-arabinofuranosidase
MKDVDRSVQLVLCGSCSVAMPTYMQWDRKVLEYVGGIVDYISLHRYVGNQNKDTADYLAVTNSIDQQIEEMDAVCRFVQARRRSKKRIFLCFDEWNVWYKNMQINGEGAFAPHLIEEVYNLEDALVVAGFLNSFIRHADVVKVANLAQIVNIIAPILTREDEMLVQSIFYPLEMFSKRREGTALRIVLEGRSYESASYGKVFYADASAILDEQRLNVFITNRSHEEKMEACIRVADRNIAALENAELLTGPDPKAANSFENQEVVFSKEFNEMSFSHGQATVEIPPLSFLAVTLRLE